MKIIIYKKEENIEQERYEIVSYCEGCKDGYYKIGDNICQPLDITNCSLLFLFTNFENNETKNDKYSEYYNQCNSICYNSKYVQINYYYEENIEVNVTTVLFNGSEYNNNTSSNGNNNNNNNNNYSDKTDYKNDTYFDNKTNYDNESNAYLETDFTQMIKDYYTEAIISDENLDSDTMLKETHTEIKTIKKEFISGEYFRNPNRYELNSQIMNIIAKGHLCLYNSGKGDKLSPTHLRKCRIAEYIETNDTYICISCVEGYSLDNETNTCKQSIQVKMNLRPGFDNCYARNIGTYSNPIYSCMYCYYSNYILATTETGANFCVQKEGELKGCTRAYVNTTYLNNVYNCTSCIDDYIPYYNIFFIF